MELEKIKAIIAEVLNIDADSITEDTTFVDDLGADSILLRTSVLPDPPGYALRSSR